jgi:quercetin dioxygenase-like cupin family protein
MNLFNLTTERAILTPGLEAKTKVLSPTFYPELEAEFNGFAGHVLISQHHFAEDWPTWEVHPAGDEFVTLITGDITLVLWQDQQEHALRLSTPSDFVIIPKGVWHTARVQAPTTMLFVTPGEGTKNATAPETD